MTHSFFVYIITNHVNTVFYTGSTSDITKRVWEHRQGLVKTSFSKRYRLYKLIWCQEFDNPIEAVENERKIKGWTRLKKVNLIKSINPTFKDLLSV